MPPAAGFQNPTGTSCSRVPSGEDDLLGIIYVRSTFFLAPENPTENILNLAEPAHQLYAHLISNAHCLLPVRILSFFLPFRC